MTYNPITFIGAYSGTDKMLYFKDSSLVETGGINVCQVQKTLTEGKELWVVTQNNTFVLTFSSQAEARQALTALNTALETLKPNCDITIPPDSGAVWGNIIGTITNQTDLVNYIASQIANSDTLAEILANGNTTGETAISSDNGFATLEILNDFSSMSWNNGVNGGYVASDVNATFIHHNLVIRLDAPAVHVSTGTAIQSINGAQQIILDPTGGSGQLTINDNNGNGVIFWSDGGGFYFDGSIVVAKSNIAVGVQSLRDGSIQFYNGTNNNSVGLYSGVTTVDYNIYLPVALSNGGYVKANNAGQLSFIDAVYAEKFTDTQSFTANVTKTITHGRGTTFISIELWDQATGEKLYGYTANNRATNTVDITLTASFANVDIIII